MENTMSEMGATAAAGAYSETGATATTAAAGAAGAYSEAATTAELAAASMLVAVAVEKITVRTGRLVCEVRVADPRFRATTPKLAAFCEAQHPDLVHHACVNEVGSAFGDVIERTTTPHLLEHLVISKQVAATQGAPATFVGTTEWLDEATGLAEVQIAFTDDLVALRALNEAVQLLNIAIATCLA